MPIYEYECVECKERVELLQRLGDPPPDACESCGGSMRRLVSAPAFQFKGSGWYVTDYAGRKSGAESESDGKSGGESGGESAGGSTEKSAASGGGGGAAGKGGSEEKGSSSKAGAGAASD